MIYQSYQFLRNSQIKMKSYSINLINCLSSERNKFKINSKINDRKNYAMNFNKNIVKLKLSPQIMSHFLCHQQKNITSHTEKQKLQHFFNYILDFKLGQQPNYKLREKNSSRSKQLNQKEKQSQFYESESYNINMIVSCSSLSAESSLRKTQEKQQIQQEKIDKCHHAIHYGYICDRCFVNPIIGQRYTCQICDYDLCGSCFQFTQNFENKFPVQVNNSVIFQSDGTHEHALKMVQKKSVYSVNIKQVILSGRKLRQSIRNSYNFQQQTIKLYRSSK